jgi:dihydroxyacetone kinase-like protein
MLVTGGPFMDFITQKELKSALIHTCDLVIASEPMLTALDTLIGDGDHGTGMREGFTELRKTLLARKFASVYELFCESGTQLVRTMGGASGVIFGTLFIGGRNAVKDKDKICSDDLICFFEESTSTISRRGRSKPGDKTMLDALLCAIDSMKEARKRSGDTLDILAAAYKGAKQGVENTKNMIPRIGRAKNFREKAIGYADPGAVSVSIIFQGLSEGICRHYSEIERNYHGIC